MLLSRRRRRRMRLLPRLGFASRRRSAVAAAVAGKARAADAVDDAARHVGATIDRGGRLAAARLRVAITIAIDRASAPVVAWGSLCCRRRRALAGRRRLVARRRHHSTINAVAPRASAAALRRRRCISPRRAVAIGAAAAGLCRASGAVRIAEHATGRLTRPVVAARAGTVAIGASFDRAARTGSRNTRRRTNGRRSHDA